MAIANFVRPIFICTMIRLRQFDSFTFIQNGLIPLHYNIFESTWAKIHQYKVTSIPFNHLRVILPFPYFVEFKKKIDPIFFWQSWSQTDLVLVNIYDSLFKCFLSFASRCMYIWKCIAGAMRHPTAKNLIRVGTIVGSNLVTFLLQGDAS